MTLSPLPFHSCSWWAWGGVADTPGQLTEFTSQGSLQNPSDAESINSNNRGWIIANTSWMMFNLLPHSCHFMRKHLQGTFTWSALLYYECLHFEDTRLSFNDEQMGLGFFETRKKLNKQVASSECVLTKHILSPQMMKTMNWYEFI